MKKFWSVLSTLALLSAGCTDYIPSKGVDTKAVAPSQENIRLLVCGNWIGTAFVIAKNLMVTANHVTNKDPCVDAVSGKDVIVVDTDLTHDYALVSMDTGDIRPIKYSCERYEKGRTYLSIGYGHGSYQGQPLKAMSDYTTKGFTVAGAPKPGMRAFVGEIVAGMSGGPILDSKLVAHGINNVAAPGFGFSFELADTPLCVFKS